MSRRSKRNESAAVLVEAAIVTPLFVLLLMAVAWGSLLFYTGLTVGHNAKVGARAGSVASTAPDADYQILSAIKPTLSTLQTSNVQRIVVYRATGFDQAPPQSCVDGIASASCNVYTGADLNRASSTFGSGGNGTDQNFSPTLRSGSLGSPTYLGVYVRAYAPFTSMGLPGPRTISKYQVLAVEPTSY